LILDYSPPGVLCWFFQRNLQVQ